MVRETERNLPARRWLGDMRRLEDKVAPAGEVVVDRNRFDEIPMPGGVAISVLGSIARPG